MVWQPRVYLHYNIMCSLVNQIIFLGKRHQKESGLWLLLNFLFFSVTIAFLRKHIIHACRGQFPTIIAYFRVHVNIFGPFSDYLIGHPSALQTTTNVD